MILRDGISKIHTHREPSTQDRIATAAVAEEAASKPSRSFAFPKLHTS